MRLAWSAVVTEPPLAVTTLGRLRLSAPGYVADGSFMPVSCTILLNRQGIIVYSAIFDPGIRLSWVTG